MAYSPRTTRQILQALAARVVARGELSDLTEGSVLMTVLASVAEEITSVELRLEKIRDAYFLETATGGLLDDRASEMPPIGLRRLASTNASGAVLRLTRDSSVGTLTVPAGSSVRGSNGVVYATTADFVFQNGVAITPADELIYVVAAIAGTDGNTRIGTITTLDLVPPEVIAATNTVAITNGQTGETDGQLRRRILLYLSSLARCQPRALEYAALSFVDSNGSRCKYAAIFEDVALPGYSELVVDDGTGTMGGDRAGAYTNDVIPSGGAVLLWHEAPATAPISSILVTQGGVASILHASDGHFNSIPERGIVYLKPGTLNPGDVWMISGYRVYTGFVADLQQEIEGSTSDPTGAAGLRAAGTRVRVRPAIAQDVRLDAHIIPITGVELAVVSAAVKTDITAFLASLSPGETLYIAQLIDAVMNNTNLVSVRIFAPGTTTPLGDVGTTTAYQSLRTSADKITIIPAPEE